MKNLKFKAMVIGICSLALLLYSGVRAQNYSIDWSTLDGGGGASTGGVYSVSGTIGQPDAGRMSGGNYDLEGGFWAVTVAIQVEGPQFLTISKSGPASVTISWPSPSGFVLQENSSLDTTTWVNVAQSPSDNGITRSITVSPIGQKFYRLKK